MATVVIIENGEDSERALVAAVRQALGTLGATSVGSLAGGWCTGRRRSLDGMSLDPFSFAADGFTSADPNQLAVPAVPIDAGIGPATDANTVEDLQPSTTAEVAGARGSQGDIAPPARPVTTQRQVDRTTARVSSGMFVGRHRESFALCAAIDEAVGGTGRMILLAGEAGIGKKSLVAQGVRYAGARGLRTLYGRCHETGGAPPYWPWMQILRASAERPAVSAESRGVAAAAPWSDLESASGLETDAELFGVFSHVTAYLQQAARQQPLLIILADLHWADERSIRLLRFVARELALTPALVIGTYRDGDIDADHALARALAELRREPLFRQLRLRGLSEAEVRELAAAIAERDIPEDFARHLYRRSEGNPFAVREVLRQLVDEGSVFHDGAQWICRRGTDELPVLESVRSAPGLFRLQGEYWTIAHDGTVLHLKDSKGLRYVAYLLRHPGQTFRAVDVVIAAYQGAGPGSSGDGRAFDQSSQPIADRQTLSEWRGRLAELQEELADATACNDLGRLGALRDEAEWLARQLKEACGLGGRQRGLPSVAERARQALTKGVRNVVRRIERDNANLAGHLARYIKTGCLCGYEPDADQAIAWEL